MSIVEAGKLAKNRVPNLYDEKLYAGTLGRFNIDYRESHSDFFAINAGCPSHY